MDINRLENIFNLIRENLKFLLSRTSLAIIAILVIFSVFLSFIFYVNGIILTAPLMVSLWIGCIAGLLSLNFSFPLVFSFIKKKEIPFLENPQKLFNLYFAGGLIAALFMMMVPLIGLFIVLRFFGYHSLIFFLMGISIVAFFVRVGGGIFAKSADISSHFMSANLNEDKKVFVNDYRNASSIGDKIGDFFNNGLALNLDIVETFLAIIVVIILYLSSIYRERGLIFTLHNSIINYPIIILTGSVILSFFSGLLLLFLKRRTVFKNTLKLFHVLYLSMGLITIFTFFVTKKIDFSLMVFTRFFSISPIYSPFICVLMGLMLAVIIGINTDYFTSDSHTPVRELVAFSEYNSIINKLTGLAIGMCSLFVPIVVTVVFILIGFKIASYFGILMIAIGLLSLSPVIIAVSLFSPFADNVNGIAKMENLDKEIIKPLKAYNATGNTMSALAKNFSSYGVMIIGFALFIIFVRQSGLNYQSIPMFHPVAIASLFIGGLLPFLLSALLIRGLAFTSIEMFDESQMQLDNVPYLIEKKAFPDIRRFITVSGIKIVKNLVLPTLIVMLIPILLGKFFGIEILSSMFVGILLTGTMLAITFSNSGAALDNAKKYIEKGYSGGEGTPTFQNVILGDLFGDGLKDLLGPSLHNFIKLIIITAIIIIPIII